MADHNTIAAVSETLRGVLNAGLSTLVGAPGAELHDFSTAVPTAPPRVTLFLFEVVEDPLARNRANRIDTAGGGLSLRKPVMTLLLRYLVTPWSEERVTDQRLLGRVMQILFDEPILSGPVLAPPLDATADSLKVTLSPLTLEERTRVWHSIQRPYRLSISYEVRVVNLDPDRSRAATPVAARRDEWAMAEGGA